MSAAASPSDIIRAVERWARVRGFHPDNPGGSPWLCFENVMREVTIRIPFTTSQWAVSPAIALAWALLIETGAASVDVGRCPACDGCGSQWWSSDAPDAPWPENKAYSWKPWPRADWMGKRRCPACTGTGRETIPAERLLLDVASGDATARDRLLVRADQMQEQADPIGELLGWALTLWTGEPTASYRCERCCGTGYGHPVPYGPFQDASGRVEFVLQESPCSACDAAGRQPGHPHTADAVAWLGRLTDVREDDVDEAVYGARFREFQRDVAQQRRPG